MSSKENKLVAFNCCNDIPSDDEKADILNEWKDKLLILETELDFRGISQSVDKEKGIFKSTFTEWDNKKQIWIITISQYSCKKSLIHEFGHILLEKKLKFRAIGENYNELLFNYCNFLIDSFADFLLISYKEYYQILKEVRFEDLDKIYPRNNEVTSDLYMFFLYYIQLNFILNDKDKVEKKTKISEFFSLIENLIVNKDGSFTFESLNQLKKILNKFNEVKKTTELSDLRNFIFEVINYLQIVDKKYLDSQLDMFLNPNFS